MTRVKVEIRTMRNGDESMLLYLAEETLQRHAAAFAPGADALLPPGGHFHFRVGGEIAPWPVEVGIVGA